MALNHMAIDILTACSKKKFVGSIFISSKFFMFHLLSVGVVDISIVHNPWQKKNDLCDPNNYYI